MAIASGILFWHHQERLLEDRGRLKSSIENGAVVLFWHGSIEVPMAVRLEEAFARFGEETDRFILDLHSPGGALREGARVIAVIRRIRKTHILDTRVGAGRECLSMCVPIYLQGEARLASASSLWMFHQPRRVNYITGEDARVLKIEKQYFSKRFFERYFSTSPIDPEWLRRLEQEWKDREVWLSGQQLADEESDVITELF